MAARASSEIRTASIRRFALTVGVLPTGPPSIRHRRSGDDGDTGGRRLPRSDTGSSRQARSTTMLLAAAGSTCDWRVSWCPIDRQGDVGMTVRQGRPSLSTIGWPLAVFGAVALLALAGFGVTRRIATQQESSLLEERHGEVAALLRSTVGGIESSLRTLSAVVAGSPDGDVDRFGDVVAAMGSGSSTVGLLVPDGAGFRFGAVSGAAGSPDQVGDARAAIATRALRADDLAAGLFSEGGTRRVMLAVPAGELVVFEELAFDPNQRLASTPDSPYSDLRMVLYASSVPDPEDVVLTTESEFPLPGTVLRHPFAVGAEQWTLAVAAREPLSGSLATNAPWLWLAGGLITAVLAGSITYTVARRRSYALALVATRTADLRAAQESAERANRSKSEFLSRMSHELRTPLNSVLGFGQLLELDDLTPSQHDAVAHIRKGGEHLLQLINEVLDISRVETGTIALSPEAVRVGDLIADSVDLVRPLADQRSIHLTVDRSGAWDHHVFADRQRTKQILLNLLSNAVKYNRQHGTVAVGCTAPDPGSIRVDVSDTGPGIRPEDLDGLFVPFERLGAERSDVEGTGIGLALSRSLAEAMGARLTVDTLPGRGSTFSLELPAVEGPIERYDRLNGSAAVEAPSEPGPEPEAHRSTVLHIEDNLANLALVERIINQRPGVKVVAAMHGRLGVELAHEHRPKLILLDLHLPDINGEEVLQRLRDDPLLASTPVVIVSADATPGQIQRLLAVGAAAYLTKPIEVRDLLRLLDDALRTP
jgi:signal transduction histidine kinase/CheY-like chemotaxis protein